MAPRFRTHGSLAGLGVSSAFHSKDFRKGDVGLEDVGLRDLKNVIHNESIESAAVAEVNTYVRNPEPVSGVGRHRMTPRRPSLGYPIVRDQIWAGSPPTEAQGSPRPLSRSWTKGWKSRRNSGTLALRLPRTNALPQEEVQMQPDSEQTDCEIPQVLPTMARNPGARVAVGSEAKRVLQ
jgi:hypothetical protein